MSDHRREVRAFVPLLAATFVFTACMTEIDRTQVETFGKPSAQTSWGDGIWGPSREPLPESFDAITPAPVEAGWERVSEWTGEGPRKTELFSVDAEWQIVWTSGARNDGAPLRIKAFAIPGDILVANVSQDGESPAAALTLRGGGTFYLEVDGAGGPWHVAIEVPRYGNR